MRILVVEDDRLLNNTLCYNLNTAGYAVDSALTKSAASSFLTKQDYDLIVLDVNLPDGNGFDFCREVKERRPDTAIIFLTANDMESDMLKGYELGAEDYVTKPFPMSVFQKKLAVVLGRLTKQYGGDTYEDGTLTINFSEMSATLSGKPLAFTPLEYRLLKILMKNPQIVLTRQVLLEKLWDADGNFVDEHALTAAISRVRNKIETPDRQYIKTVYGIYNVFYISIAQDIRFYGMLKTLGTTARQIRKIVYRKAIKLSLMGIPIGLLLGWPIGRLLLPAIVNMLTDDIRIVTTVNPLIFLVAIVFSAITVFISCQKPAILAAKVSPMEALHYIEQTGGKKKQRRSKHISTMMMAKNNLTRNKKKVMIVTLSFALSIVLLNSVYTYVTSFDFDKFVADFSLTDFTVSDTTVINNYAPYNTANVSQDFISQAESLNGLEDIGNIYLWTSKQPLSENDLARLQELSACSSDIANELENYRVRQEHGVNVYGLDDFPAEYVQVLDGELNTEQWKAGTGVYVTPLRMMGDGSLCLYKPGDQISVTQLDGTNKVYDVLAVVSIPSALQTPLQVDMGLDYIFPTNELLGNMVSADQPAMKTIFNVDEEHQLATENWLKNYTTNTDTALDYLSKVTLRQTFDGMINMYRLVGGALCAILALIGILNFINSMTTSILSRYGEIAMLQSVGMTGRQVKQMLIYEGIGYSILGLLGSLILSVIASLTVVRMMGAELTYFTWHFTLIPVFLCIIPLILITAIVPLVCYNKMAQKTVVERLRLAE